MVAVDYHPQNYKPVGSCPKKEQIMGKVILYIGLVILLLGCSPLLIVGLLSAIGIGDPKPNPVGFGCLFYFTFWPGVILTAVGTLICICKYLLGKLPFNYEDAS